MTHSVGIRTGHTPPIQTALREPSSADATAMRRPEMPGRVVATASGTPGRVAGALHPAARELDLLRESGLLADPHALMTAVQAQLRNTKSEQKEARIEDAKTDADREHKLRMEALEAANKGGGLLGGRLKKALQAIATIAALASSAVTGPVGAALAVAGAALLYGGQPVADAMANAGILDEKQAMAMGMALQLTGAALMVASGSVGGGSSVSSGAQTASKMATVGKSAKSAASMGQQTAKAVRSVQHTVDTLLQHVHSGAQIAGGGLQAHEEALELRHARHMVEAGEHEVRHARAMDGMQAHVQDLSQMFDEMSRIQERLRAAHDARAQAKRAATQLLV